MTIPNIHIQVERFALPTSEVTEYHAIIQVTNALLTFNEQLKAIDNALTQLTEGCCQGAAIVFKRYFLSDAYNQTAAVMSLELEYSDYALSVVQQPPLNGTKVALWVYLQTGMETCALPSGLYEARHGAYRHLWNASAHNLAKNSEYQTRLLLNEYVMQLTKEGCRLADHGIRTWFFVNDVDNNYPGVVKARNEVFYTQDLTDKTHFIASTGIGGRQADPKVAVQMDNYAICGIRPEQIRFLYAQTHLNRTSDYGVSFERGTRVDYGDRCHVFISGTASINNKGEVMHAGNVVAQTHRMWENVEALLAEGGCTFDDVRQMVVYLRDAADYRQVSQMYAERFPQKPYVIVQASVCRPAWLVEMECMAIRQADNPQFEAL